MSFWQLMEKVLWEDERGRGGGASESSEEVPRNQKYLSLQLPGKLKWLKLTGFEANGASRSIRVQIKSFTGPDDDNNNLGDP